MSSNFWRNDQDGFLVKHKTQYKNKIRIIAGKHRGRMIQFDDHLNLRPTPDRVRETLFNWLQDLIIDSVCLDLFAGSGVLSFEAVSRGARQVLAIDSNTAICKMIEKQSKELSIGNIMVKNINAFDFLKTINNQYSFDLVFLDPPYQQIDIVQVLQSLDSAHCLSSSARIYFESGREIVAADLPEHWRLLKSKKAGQVYYYLAELDAAD